MTGLKRHTFSPHFAILSKKEVAQYVGKERKKPPIRLIDAARNMCDTFQQSEVRHTTFHRSHGLLNPYFLVTLVSNILLAFDGTWYRSETSELHIYCYIYSKSERLWFPVFFHIRIHRANPFSPYRILNCSSSRWNSCLKRRSFSLSCFSRLACILLSRAVRLRSLIRAERLPSTARASFGAKWVMRGLASRSAPIPQRLLLSTVATGNRRPWPSRPSPLSSNSSHPSCRSIW